jgi:hypothetical protein
MDRKRDRDRRSADVMSVWDNFDSMARNLLDVGMESTQTLAETARDVMYGVRGDRPPRSAKDPKSHERPPAPAPGIRATGTEQADPRRRDQDTYGTTHEQRVRRARERKLPGVTGHPIPKPKDEAGSEGGATSAADNTQPDPKA